MYFAIYSPLSLTCWSIAKATGIETSTPVILITDFQSFKKSIRLPFLIKEGRANVRPPYIFLTVKDYSSIQAYRMACWNSQ